MCGAIVTSPFDVVKTRLQSSLFHQKHAAVGVSMGAGGGVIMGAPRSFGMLYTFVETGHIIRYVPILFSDQSLT
jgi:solute carrier family 25 protein 33/36